MERYQSGGTSPIVVTTLRGPARVSQPRDRLRRQKEQQSGRAAQRGDRPGNKRLTSDPKKKIAGNDSHILSEECPVARSPRAPLRRSYLAVVFRRGLLAGLS